MITTATTPATTVILEPAHLLELIRRLLDHGLPTPISVNLVTNDVQVWASDLPDWLEETASDGSWSRVEGGDVFQARARGFTITAWRDHECAPGDCGGAS